MKIHTPEIGTMVYCTYAEQHGSDPVTHTNVWDGKAFCNYCGETDHAKYEGSK